MWLQHPDTQKLLEKHAIDDIQDSWAMFEEGEISRGSTAWLRATRFLKRPWCWMRHLLYIPALLRELVYGCVARNRYRLLGKSDACQRPSTGLRRRMLHESKNR